jgi:hypothetical protein
MFCAKKVKKLPDLTVALGIRLPNWALGSEHNISNTATVGGTEKPGLIFRDGVPIQLYALSLLQKTVQIRDQFFLYVDPGQELQSQTREMNVPHQYTFNKKFSIKIKHICRGLTAMNIFKKENYFSSQKSEQGYW